MGAFEGMNVEVALNKTYVEAALNWFLPRLRQNLVGPIEGLFPNCPLPRAIREVLGGTEQVLASVGALSGSDFSPETFFRALFGKVPSEESQFKRKLLKQILLLYRRHQAANTEAKTEKTFHLELTEELQREVKALDELVNSIAFHDIPAMRLPRLKDFLPVQLIETLTENQNPFHKRQYDQKFAILQAPTLFLPDLAFLRAKCEERDAPLAVVFLDIDEFKKLNSRYTETKVDRNLLPIFLQAVEAHIYHHGYAYQEGGDELFILIPSLSKALVIAFLEELRIKLSKLKYPEIEGSTTVSMGMVMVEPDCALTDRELRDASSQAKKFAKENGRNCIATFQSSRIDSKDLVRIMS